jgi:hypothetical protein
MWLGDFRTGKTIRFGWHSNAVAGESITRATNGTVSVYKDGGTTQSTAGVTDSEDFDSLTGVHLVTIDTSADGTFYSAGSDFMVTLNGATIDGKSINAVLAHFSLEARSALMPTTDGRKLDVSAGGEAGVDWANVGSPTTTVGLSGTTVKTATDVETDTADIQSRLPAALTGGGNIKADALAISGDTVAADNLEAAADGTGFNLGGGSVVAASVTGAVGSVTGNVGGNVAGSVASVTARVTANTDQIEGVDATDQLRDANVAIVRRNTAQAGAAGTITLDASASATDDLYNDLLVLITGGTGAGQARLISDYVGSTKVASVVPNWVTNPSSDSVFVILAGGRADLALWLGSAPNALQSGRVDSYIGAVAAGVIAAASFAAGALDAVWSTTTRLLTAGTNIVLAKGTGVTGFNDLDAAGVRSAVGLASANLDTQIDALPTAAENADAVWDEAVSDHVGAGSVGERVERLDLLASGGSGGLTNARAVLLDNLDAAVSTRATPAQVNTEADTALADVGLTSIVTGRIDATVSSRASQTSVDTIDDYVDTEVAAIKAKTDLIPSNPAAVGDIPTANQNADALLDRAAGVETGWTLRQAFRIMLSALAGKADGAATATMHYRDMADSKDRITATVDANGNRTAVTRDAT